MGPLTGRLSLDLRSLALFRMVLGLTLLIDHVWFRWGEALAFYGSEGLLSPEMFERLVEADPHRSLQRFSLLHLADSEAWLYAVLTVATLVYLAFLLGWRTRISGLLSVMTLWSLHARNPYIVEAPDHLLMALLFWASFAPVDQRWAIRPSPDPGPGWTAASSGALQLQVVFLYLFNAYNKSGVTWTEGSAVQIALMEDLWLRHPTSGWLLDHPGWCELLTYGTVYTEYAIGLLVLAGLAWWGCRAMAVLLILGLHWGIFIFLTLGLFPGLCTAAACALIPGQTWQWLGIEDAKARAHRAMPPLLRLTWASSLLLVVSANLWQLTDLDQARRPWVHRYLDHTTLFQQTWSLYAPNATLRPGTFRVVGQSADGSLVDLWEGAALDNHPSRLQAYQVYPWQAFFYNTALYRHEYSRELLERWANLELARAPGEVELVEIRMTTWRISPQLETTPRHTQVIGRARRLP